MTKTADRWGDFDSAQMKLDIAISVLAERIFAEEKKATSDLDLIESWQREQDQLTDVRGALDVNDVATIFRINSTMRGLNAS